MKNVWILLAITAFCAPATQGQNIDTGLKMMKYQRYQSAIEIFKKLSAANSSDDKAAYWRGIAEIRNKNADTAIAHYNNSIKEPKSNLLLAGLANAYAAAGKKGDALKILLLFDKGPDGVKMKNLWLQ
ncbi:MAG: hypothetical protein IPI88_17750 [Chitinophagaceae bacterium]|nr:hypothetical protein [Chitinophagaceae bacterium]